MRDRRGAARRPPRGCVRREGAEHGDAAEAAAHHACADARTAAPGRDAAAHERGGAGTAAQGIFLDATNGTTGKLLNLRNAGDSKIVATSDGKLLATGGLGVGNSAPASAITGAVVRKVEVFDRNGASLGFVPVYSSIG